jgi:hypothetical protein
MSQDVFKSYKKLLLTFLSIACITLCSYAAFADTTTPAGCDPKVIKAQKARAQAKDCADKAIRDEINDQPSGVGNSTCFNKSASTGIKEGCKIFGNTDDPDSCINDLKDIIEPALENFRKQFPDSAGSKNPNTADYYNADSAKLTDGSDASCDAMDKEWKDGEDKGINKKVPTAFTDEELQSDTPPKCDDGAGNQTECGDDFKKAWKACAEGTSDKPQHLFKDYKDAMAALHPPSVPDFTGADSSCEVMHKAGISGPCTQ